jgi:putative transcriptional regulator
MSKTTITAKIRSDGRVVEVLKDGSEREFRAVPMRAMSDEEIAAAAESDPHARPMTPGELRSAKRVPRTRTLRRALALTQEEFAARFHIPARHLAGLGTGTLRTGPACPCVFDRDCARS